MAQTAGSRLRAERRVGAAFLPAETTAQRQIATWLFAVAVLVAAMVVVGGATRLTDSGLSITEWKPVTGVVPPLSAEGWESEFAKYRDIPEYSLVNSGMTLSEFKSIYWWEWGHRLLGRVVGIAFFVPFVWFFFTRKVSRDLAPKLAALFIAGGAQGALGWFMVQSGLADRVDVSQYRLAAHLALAFAIFGAILWVALDLLRPRRGVPRTPLTRLAFVFVGLVFLQVVFGAFVAGLDAGMSFNTWPLIDGGLVPGRYFFLTPWYANLFENAVSVQFNHRVIGYLVALAGGGLWLVSWRSGEALPAPLAVLLGLAALQVGLGIWTLVAAVPLSLGLAHQAGALALFAGSIVFAHSRLEGAGDRRAAAA